MNKKKDNSSRGETHHREGAPNTIRTIRGSIKQGRRPFIQIYGVRCTTPEMQSSLHLIGQRIVISAAHDKESLKAYLEDGSFLGELISMSPRFQKPITWEHLQLRQERIRFERKILLYPNRTARNRNDPVRHRPKDKTDNDDA